MVSFFKPVFVGAALLISIGYFVLYGREWNSFQSDALSYHTYLTATFIYHNHHKIDSVAPNMDIPSKIAADIKGFGNFPPTPKGYHIIPYSYGTALLELPFFLIAHSYERLNGRKANGYTAPYNYMRKAASVFYAILGLFLIYNILARFFPKNLSLYTTITIFIGTNLFWFTLKQSGMSHVPLFFLNALLLYATIRMYEIGTWSFFAMTGLALGMIVASRPPDGIMLLIPLCYGIVSKKHFLQRIQWLYHHKKNIFVAIGCFLSVLIPQMLYWKIFAGTYIFNSYINQTFNWLNPQLLKGLFSAQNGWLFYTPVMLFAILGIFYAKRIEPFRLTLYILVPLYMYIIYSWWCWYYTGGLGSRPMIHLYPLLSLPLAGILQYFAEKRFKIRLIAFTVLLFCIIVNLCHSVHAAEKKLWSQDANQSFVVRTLFKKNLSYNDLVLFDTKNWQPKEKDLSALKNEPCILSNEQSSTGNTYWTTPQMDPFPKPICTVTISENYNNIQWIKAEAVLASPEKITDLYLQHRLVVDVMRGNRKLSTSSIRINNKLGHELIPRTHLNLMQFKTNTWSTLSFFIPVKRRLNQGDVIQLYIWNLPLQKLYVKRLCLQLFTKREEAGLY